MPCAAPPRGGCPPLGRWPTADCDPAPGTPSGDPASRERPQGIGNYSHLSGVWFGFATGTQPTFVPYGSNNPYIDLVGGEVQLMLDGLPVATSNIQPGKLKLLAITGKKRHATFPDTPTFEELGIKDYSPVAWQGLLAPAGTPKAAIDRLAAAMRQAPANAELAKKWTQYGGSWCATRRRSSKPSSRKTARCGARSSGRPASLD